ncbi:hypothetical protein Avbf_09155 [Armadillidium vulgare]|nr:hypothetical protein Avbf_09155 [Armadillidium vulgare]
MNDSLRRYFAYCIYAWGCPFLITCFTSAMHLIPIEDFPESIRGYIVKPGFAKGRCWFESGLPVFLYYVLFEGLLHIFNAIFMGQAAYLLFQDQIKKVCSRYCCCCCCFFKNNNETQEKIRKHASSNHIQTRVMVGIMSLHCIFFFLVIIQSSRNAEVKEFFTRKFNSIKEYLSHFGVVNMLNGLAETQREIASTVEQRRKEEDYGVEITRL